MYILITLVVDLAKRALSRVDEDFTQPEKIRTLCVKTLGFEKVRLCIESSVNFDLQLIHRLYHKCDKKLCQKLPRATLSIWGNPIMRCISSNAGVLSS